MAAVIAGAVAFLGIASLIKPDPRSASAYENGATPIHPAAHAPNINGRSMQGDSHDILVALSMQAHPQGWRLIGSLEGTEHLVLVYSSPNGPRYSVFTLQGRLVAGGLEAGEVYRVVPELDMTTLRDLPESDGKPLMLVTPQD